MMKRRIYHIAVAMALCIFLAGCGKASDDTDNAESTAAREILTETILAEAPGMPISELKPEITLLYHTGSLTKEEESAALDMLITMYHNLELPEYFGEGIHVAESEAWYDILAKNLLEGCRSYYLQQEGKTLLSAQIGYGISGELFTNISLSDERDILMLKLEGAVVQLTQAQVQGTAYDGSYERWQIDGASGGIRQEKGTYSAGMLTGEYTVAVREGTGEGDPFDLWNMRENFAYKTTVTVYDEAGNVVEPTPEPEVDLGAALEEAKPEAESASKPSAKPAAKPASKPTTKPASRPVEAAPSAPAPTVPAPSPTAPVPAPAAPSVPAPAPSPVPTPTPAVPAAPDAGDVDIEWSDDMM